MFGMDKFAKERLWAENGQRTQPQSSECVRPQQGTELCNFREPPPRHFLEFSPVDVFPFFPGLLCNLKGNRPKCGEIARFPGEEKSAESCHVSGCHGCFGPEILRLPNTWEGNTRWAYARISTSPHQSKGSNYNSTEI